MDPCRGAPVQGGMGPSVVVKVHVGIDAFFGIPVIGIFASVDLLVFEAPPEAFDKGIIQCPASAVHGDFDSIFLEQTNPLLPGEGIRLSFHYNSTNIRGVVRIGIPVSVEPE